MQTFRNHINLRIATPILKPFTANHDYNRFLVFLAAKITNPPYEDYNRFSC